MTRRMEIQCHFDAHNFQRYFDTHNFQRYFDIAVRQHLQEMFAKLRNAIEKNVVLIAPCCFIVFLHLKTLLFEVLLSDKSSFFSVRF